MNPGGKRRCTDQRESQDKKKERGRSIILSKDRVVSKLRNSRIRKKGKKVKTDGGTRPLPNPQEGGKKNRSRRALSRSSSSIHLSQS